MCRILTIPLGVSLIPGVRESIAAFRTAGYAVIIVTNQSGLARGLVLPDQYRTVEAAVIEVLGSGLVDATYACPFHPEHRWRKPEPGMLLAAVRDHGLALADSIMVGDTLVDMMAGAEAGVARVVHVLTGHGAQERGEVDAWTRRRESGNFPNVGLADSLGDLHPAEMDR